MPLRILILEDHLDTRAAFRRFLEARGHVVVDVGLLAEGIETLRESDVDAVISDINLPDGSGLDLLERAKPTDPAYAIVISANNADEDRRRSVAAGFKLHLAKPVSIVEIDEFLARAEEAVARRHAA